MATTSVNRKRRLRLGVALSVGALLTAALVAASTSSARSSTYGVTPTKVCLTKKGATFPTTTPGVVHAGLTAAQQAETLIGTLPAGGAPAFFFLVVGRSPADAAAVLKVLKSDLPPGTPWSGTKENAAWTLVSITGPLTSAVKTTFLSCLTEGAAPTGVAPSPSSYTATPVGKCLDALSNGGVMRPKEMSRFVPLAFSGKAVPATVLPHALLVYTATNASSRDGIGIFILFGRNSADAMTMRGSLQRALGLSRDTTLGAKKNAAWLAFPTRHTTLAGKKAGLKVLATCLN